MKKYFWEAYERQGIDALSEIVNIPPAYVIDFIKSLNPVYQIITRQKYDAIFIPERGAVPLQWVLETMCDINNQHTLNFLSVPIGTHVDTANNIYGGYPSTVKREILEEEIQRSIRSKRLNPSFSNIALIDEAQSGSTSATATILLKDILRNLNPKLKITYIPCKDEGRDIEVRKADPLYKAMATGEDGDIEGYSIPVPMFYIDRPLFLNTLFIPSNVLTTQENGQPENLNPQRMIHTMINTQARKTFRCLTLLILIPEIAHTLITDGYNENTISLEHKDHYLEVKRWAIEILSKYPDNPTNEKIDKYNKNKRREIVSWFRKISNLISES